MPDATHPRTRFISKRSERHRRRSFGCVWLVALVAGLSAHAASARPTATLSLERETFHDKVFGADVTLQPVADELMVRFRQDVASADARATISASGLDVVRPYSRRLRLAVLSAPIDPAEQARRLLASEHVTAVAVPRRDAEGYTKYFLPDEVTVRFEANVSDSVARARIDELDCRIVRQQRTPGYYTLRLAEPSELFETVRRFVAMPEVRFSEPSYVSYDDALASPDDSLLPMMWHVTNDGQRIGTFGADIALDGAWEYTLGDPDVVVAVIDTGVELEHEDLAANLLPRNGEDWDFADFADRVPADEDGHGTACCGIVGAVAGNDTGVRGVAPGCRILPLRIDLSPGRNQNRADAIHYAATRRADFSAMVLSLSWRMSSGSTIAVHDAIAEAHAVGCVIVAASGNGGSDDMDYPAMYAETISVGATSPCDERKSSASCDGESWWGSDYGPALDVVAPGVFVVTTDRSGDAGYVPGDYHYGFNGTSAACPMAAGVCALVLSVDPTLDPESVRTLLHETAVDQIGAPHEDVPGFDPYMGWGRIDAFAAVREAAGPRPHLRDVEVTLRHEWLGNDNGVIDPGEVVALDVVLENVGTAAAASPVARLEIDVDADPDASVGLYRSAVAYPSLPSGASSNATEPFVLVVPDTAPEGRALPLTLEVECGGVTRTLDLEIETGRATARIFDDLEGVGVPWCHEASEGDDDWAIVATPLARSPVHAWHAGEHGAASDSSMRPCSPFLVPEGATLQFWHAFDTDDRYDGAVFEISFDAGANFHDAAPLMRRGGYSSLIDARAATAISGRPAWTGPGMDVMRRVVIDLGDYAGRTIVPRWRFVSDAVIESDGWWIDDIALTARECEPVDAPFAAAVLGLPAEIRREETFGLEPAIANRTQTTTLAKLEGVARLEGGRTKRVFARTESVAAGETLRLHKAIVVPVLPARLTDSTVQMILTVRDAESGALLGAGYRETRLVD